MNIGMNLAMAGLQHTYNRKRHTILFLLKYSGVCLNFISNIRIHEIGLPLLSNVFSEMPSSAISQKITSLQCIIVRKLKSNPFLRHLPCDSEHIKNMFNQAYLLLLLTQVLQLQTDLLHRLSKKG